MGLVLCAALVAGCGQQVALPPASVASTPEAAATGSIGKNHDGPMNATFVVALNPTDAYAAVARGALNCWFGANGPMKRSHVFHGEAAPAAKGGAAEILLQERDPSLADQRGIRAFRATFMPAGAGTQVGIAHLKVDPAVATALTRDVETWARGEAGCQLRTVLAPVPDPIPQPKVARIKTTR